MPVIYKGERLANDLRLDLIIDDKVILELKSVTEYRKLFEKQLFTYLVLKNCEIGYVVNFNEENLRDGIHTVYNSRYGKKSKEPRSRRRGFRKSPQNSSYSLSP